MPMCASGVNAMCGGILPSVAFVARVNAYLDTYFYISHFLVPLLNVRQDKSISSQSGFSHNLAGDEQLLGMDFLMIDKT